MEPMETMYSPTYLPGRQYGHGSSSIYESPLDLSISTVQQASAAMIPDPENITLPHGGRFLGQSGSSSSVFSQTHMLYPSSINVSNCTSFQQPVNFDVRSTRRMPVLFPYGHPPSSFALNQNHAIAFNQNSYVQQPPSSPATTNHRVDIQVNGQHMSGWTAKKDHCTEFQFPRNGQKNLKVYQNGPLTFSCPPNHHNHHSLNSSDTSTNILNTSQVYNTSRLSPIILPSAVAPSALPHIRKKEGADGNQKDSPRTARDFPDQPGQTVSFPRASCTSANIEDSGIIINSGNVGSVSKSVNSGQPENSFYVAKNTPNNIDEDCVLSSEVLPSFKQKEPVNLGESSSFVANISDNSDSNFSTTMPRLRAVSPGGHRNSTENSTSPLGPPPLIAAVDSSVTSKVQEQNTDVPKLLPQVFQWHEPSGKPNSSDSPPLFPQSKCSISSTSLSRSTCDATLSETISAILENKSHVFQQGEQLSVVLQLPNLTRNTASPSFEDCRKKVGSLPQQSSFFCPEQKFTSPLPMDSVINKHHSSRGDMPLFSPQAHSVWNISSNNETLSDSKSFAVESAGMSAIHVDCHSYIHQIKTEKQSPVERELAGASNYEDSKPVMLEAAESSNFHNHHKDSFHNTALCNIQDKKKPDPIVIGTSAVSDFFQNLESKYCPSLPPSGNVQTSFITHNCGRAKCEFDDQTHLVSSLTSKSGNRGNNVLTYAEIHPVPKEYLGSHRSIDTDSVVSLGQQNIPCTLLHPGAHSVELRIKKESIEVDSDDVFLVQKAANEVSILLGKEKYLMPSVIKKSVASSEHANKSTHFAVDKQICARKPPGSSGPRKPSTKHQNAGSPGLIEAPSFTVKQETYTSCERFFENSASSTDNSAVKSDPVGITFTGLKRKPDLKISSLSLHSQAKKRKASSRCHIKDKFSCYKVDKTESEHSQLLCEDEQSQDIAERATDMLVDIERTRRTTFIDFKPEVLESRTRHQKSTHDRNQGRRGKRRFGGNRRTRGRPKRYQIHSPAKNIRKTRLHRSPRKLLQNEPSLDSNSIDDSSLCSLQTSTDRGQENVPLFKEKLTSETYSKDGTSHSEICDYSVSSPNDNQSFDSCVYSSIQQDDKNKTHVIRHQRRRRLKSGLDMIRKKKSGSKKKTIYPPVIKEQKEKKKPQVTDLRKIVFNKSLGESPLHRAARQGNLELVQLCIASNFCSVNRIDNAGYTPLHEACSKGHLEVARILLQNNADANSCATGGVRPIHDAVENDYVEIVRLLLSYGADPTISTYSGRTLGSFVKSRVMERFLRGYFADVGIVSDVSLFGSSSTYMKTWSFAGSASCLDPQVSGYDVCSLHQLDAKASCKEDPGFLFESSEQEIIPTFRFSLSSDSESQTYVLLQDVLHHLHVAEKEFRVRYPEVETITVPVHDFKARAACCQIMANPVIPQNSYTVQIILYTEQIRSILGIKAMYIVL